MSLFEDSQNNITLASANQVVLTNYHEQVLPVSNLKISKNNNLFNEEKKRQ